MSAATRHQRAGNREEDRADRANRAGERSRRDEERGAAQRDYREAHKDARDYRQETDEGRREKTPTGDPRRSYSKEAPVRSAGEKAALKDAPNKIKLGSPFDSRPRDEVGTPGQDSDLKYGTSAPLDRGSKRGGVDGPAPDRRMDRVSAADDR